MGKSPSHGKGTCDEETGVNRRKPGAVHQEGEKQTRKAYPRLPLQSHTHSTGI
jgi:hypothetical protein